MDRGNGDLQRIYEEIIKITTSIGIINGKLDSFVTHEKHAEEAVKRDSRITDNLLLQVDDLRRQLVQFETEFPERARTIIQAEIPAQIDMKNKRDAEVVRRAQILGFVGAGGGIGGILLWAMQSLGAG